MSWTAARPRPQGWTLNRRGRCGASTSTERRGSCAGWDSGSIRTGTGLKHSRTRACSARGIPPRATRGSVGGRRLCGRLTMPRFWRRRLGVGQADDPLVAGLALDLVQHDEQLGVVDLVGCHLDRHELAPATFATPSSCRRRPRATVMVSPATSAATMPTTSQRAARRSALRPDGVRG